MLREQTVGGRYRLREPLGHGGMSVVWRADDELLGREVAVKVLSADVSADPDALRRLYAEARAAAGLRHDNVVEVYDYGTTDAGGAEVPYVVMELVEGRSLHALLTGGPLPWRLAMLVAAQVAAALAAAHDRGVVHRDVKPANVMVTADGVKLVDFGISAAVGDRDPDSGQILGTPAYLAPERLVSGIVRPSTDVYALGLLMYMMLAGRLPWSASTTTQMLLAHMYRDPAVLPAVPGLPPEVITLVRQCLAKQPSDRPAAIAVARVLRRAAGLPSMALLATIDEKPSPADQATAPATAPPTTDVVWPVARSSSRGRVVGWADRHRLISSGAALLGLLVIAGAVALTWPSGGPDQPVTAAAAAATPQIGCQVTYKVQPVAAGRTSTTLTVTNEAPTAIEGWSLRFALPGGQRLLHGSNGTWRQKGDVIQLAGTGLPAGKAVQATFEATYGTSIAFPASFTLNDATCRSQLSVVSLAAAHTPAPPTPAKPAKTARPAKRSHSAPARPRTVGPHPAPHHRPFPGPLPHIGGLKPGH